MKTLRDYPGALALLLIACALLIKGLVDYINLNAPYGPTVMAAVAAGFGALALALVYEIKDFRARLKHEKEQHSH